MKRKVAKENVKCKDTILRLSCLHEKKNDPCQAAGGIVRSVAMSLGNQEAPRSILASGTSFREDLVMKLFLRPYFLFR